MILITSGAYVGQELASELGLLPSAFLPVGNRRLFRRQIAGLRQADETICLSLPEDFRLPAWEAQDLEREGVRVVRVDPRLSLGESLRNCLACLLPFEGPLRILHGDTLIRDIPYRDQDVFSLGETDAFYPWAEFRPDPDGAGRFLEGLPNGGFNREVLSGYFCFADPYVLLRALTQNGCRFIDSLNAYDRQRPLRPVRTGLWLDFGHLQTYYRSKAKLTTERDFNTLSIGRHAVSKSGRHPRKIAAEAAWYQTIPQELRRFVPAFLGGGPAASGQAYQLEYLYLATLSELYVFGKLPLFLWDTIFEACDAFLTACRGHKPGPGDAAASEGLYLDKALERLALFARDRSVSLIREWTIGGVAVPGLTRLAELAAAAVPEAGADDLGILHGDFCFSNILYDFRHGVIKTIDPRGLTPDGIPCIHGDRRYDLGKLYHSVVGKYDFIKADAFRLHRDGPRDLVLEFPREPATGPVEDMFLHRRFGGLSPCEAASPAIAVLLFLSMLPLHGDRPDHQDALLANALRLFTFLDQPDRTRGGIPTSLGSGAAIDSCCAL